MRAAVLAMNDVVNLEPTCRAASGHAAAALVAQPYRTLGGWRHVLLRAAVLDDLRVALSASERAVADRDARARRVLRRALASVAALDDDLVASAVVRFAVERAMREGGDELVVVEVPPLFLFQCEARLAQYRVRLGLQLEPQHVHARARISWLVRSISRFVGRDQLLDVTQVHLASSASSAARRRAIVRSLRSTARQSLLVLLLCVHVDVPSDLDDIPAQHELTNTTHIFGAAVRAVRRRSHFVAEKFVQSEKRSQSAGHRVSCEIDSRIATTHAGAFRNVSIANRHRTSIPRRRSRSRTPCSHDHACDR